MLALIDAPGQYVRPRMPHIRVDAMLSTVHRSGRFCETDSQIKGSRSARLRPPEQNPRRDRVLRQIFRGARAIRHALPRGTGCAWAAIESSVIAIGSTTSWSMVNDIRSSRARLAAF